MLQRDIDATCAAVSDAAAPYFNDIIVGTKREPGMSDEDLIHRHGEDLRRVLAQLGKDKWVADKAKAKLIMRSVEFCGHVLRGGKRTPAPGKLAAVQQWKTPPTVTALRAFLGLCNYYAAYVRMFAEFAAPLQEKLKLPRELGKAGSKRKLIWTKKELTSFERLKQALVSDLELHHIDTRKAVRPQNRRLPVCHRHSIGTISEHRRRAEAAGHEARRQRTHRIPEQEIDGRTAGPMGYARQGDVRRGQRA